MKSHFLHLFEYNLWANENIYKAIKESDGVQNEFLKLFSHIISSQDLWLDRIKGGSSFQIDIWQTYNLQEAEFLFNKSNDAWINFLEESSDDRMSRRKKYKNSEGEEFRNTVLEITQHVINHSNYHRAGINLLLRQNDCEPAKTDYIFYVRDL